MKGITLNKLILFPCVFVIQFREVTTSYSPEGQNLLIISFCKITCVLITSFVSRILYLHSCFLSSVFCLNQVKHELNFHDKETQFYRFQDSEFGLNQISNEKDSEEELQESLSLLSQLGPDALLTMILRKW